MTPDEAYLNVDRDPGVPEALGRAVGSLIGRVEAARLDTLWIFPPLRKGRREHGLLAAGCYGEGDRRLLVTLAYRAEETGRGVAFEARFQAEGEAPSDRLPRVMAGVARRAEEGLEDPRRVSLEGDPGRLRDLLEELGVPARPPSETHF